MKDGMKLALIALTFVGSGAAIALFGFWTVMGVMFGAAIATALVIGILE